MDHTVSVARGGIRGLGFAPEDGSKAFYEASAQVIPVIVLTLAIEARAFEWRLESRGWHDRWARGLDGYLIVAATGVVVLLMLVLAEILTLVELANGSFAAPKPTFVFTAMVMGLAMVVVVALPRGGRSA